MKKTLTIVLAACLLALAFAGCGQKPAASAASESTLGGVLYLTGTVSNASMNGFDLTLDDGATTFVQLADDTEVTVEGGILEGINVSVGCLRIDDKNVKAVTVSPGEAMNGGVLFLTGTVSNGAMHGFDLTLEDGATVYVQLDDDTEVTVKDGLLDGAKVNVGCVRIDDGNVRGVTVADQE